MTMQRVIHPSWSALAKAVPDRGADIVRFDFSGTFTEGSHEGTAFAGRIDYDPSASPTECHGSFAIYEDWPSPIVTIAIAGQILTAQGAAVYHSLFEECESHFDLVNLFGTGPFDRQEDGAFFELLFADDKGSALANTRMPTARQLRDMPVKQVALGTREAGNFISRGDLILRPAA